MKFVLLHMVKFVLKYSDSVMTQFQHYYEVNKKENTGPVQILQVHFLVNL